jgi:lipopolysaccharide/colanic/teichoic acid biosynthesis glycosyltransferase
LKTNSTNSANGIYRNVVKPIVDRLFAMAVICGGAPLFILLAIFVKLKLGSPVIFRQNRPGRGGKPFELIKFRTMTDERDCRGVLLPDVKRLTPLGKFLRNTSLDELPEFFNVLNGDLSVIGPRPLLMQYLDRYTPQQARRHWVKPGITGWAQVNGRNALCWEEKFRLDLWYVDHLSWKLDVKILALTLLKILKRENINQVGKATATEFMGSENRKECL